MSRRGLRVKLACVMLGALLQGATGWAQAGASPPATPPPQAAPAKDALGRDTPRGTVLGFMNAARAGRDEVAPQYLNTSLRDRAAADLAHKLFEVLDTRLSPRLNDLSDRPEGSLPNPLKPNQDIVGTLTTADGPMDLVLERVNREIGTIVAIITHNAAIAGMADRVVRIASGAIAEIRHNAQRIAPSDLAW